MRPLRALGIYFLVVFAGGALLAPLLYWLAQSFAAEFPKIAHSAFHRYVSRSLEGIALLGEGNGYAWRSPYIRQEQSGRCAGTAD